MKEYQQNKIMQLQMMEQNMQNVLSQKQSFQAQAAEIENALTELKETKEQVFKVIGTTMISTDKNKLEKELNSKKEILDLKIKNFEKQEKQIKEKFEELQSEVVKNIKK
jgi:prefoldin beta subunit